MPTRRQPVPAVHVDPDEDRLEEEREALERESAPEDRPEGGGETGPQEAHLKAEDRARDHPDGEQGDHHSGPAPGERAVQLVTRAQMTPLGEQHRRRECDPEADQRDVHREGQRLHLAGLVQVVPRDRSERCSDHRKQASAGQRFESGAPAFVEPRRQFARVLGEGVHPMPEGRCAPLHAKQGRRSVDKGRPRRLRQPLVRPVVSLGWSPDWNLHLDEGPPCYQPSVTRMIVLPGTRGASGPNAAGASARGRTATTLEASRPSRSRCASSASCERSASTTKKIARPFAGWIVGGSAMVTSVPPTRTSAVERRRMSAPITSSTTSASPTSSRRSVSKSTNSSTPRSSAPAVSAARPGATTREPA